MDHLFNLIVGMSFLFVCLLYFISIVFSFETLERLSASVAICLLFAFGILLVLAK